MWSVQVSKEALCMKKNLLMTTEVDCEACTTLCGFLFQNLGKLILHVVLGNTVTNVSTV